MAKNIKFLKSKKLLTILGFFGLYLFSTGIGWALFSYVLDGAKDNDTTTANQDNGNPYADLPKTEECPINGMMYSEPERDIWETRRPIAAIVENHADSRPPQGISKADVIYEIVAEGGITRFLNIFYCAAAAGDIEIAPVRSARVYFIDYASEYGEQPIFMHVGGANDYAGFNQTYREARALELLETIGWRYPKGNDFDTTYDSGYPVFWRDYERLGKDIATEHTMTASLNAAYKEADKRGFNYENEDGDPWDEGFIPWKFVDESPSGSPEATEISFMFWDNKPDYDVKWIYDTSTNSYLRENGGTPHIDQATDEQLSAKNIVILFARERGPVDENYHILYDTVGTGGALYFQNGTVQEGYWEKDSRTSRTKFFLEDDSEINFVRGKVWVEVVPKGNEIEY